MYTRNKNIIILYIKKYNIHTHHTQDWSKNAVLESTPRKIVITGLRNMNYQEVKSSKFLSYIKKSKTRFLKYNSLIIFQETEKIFINYLFETDYRIGSDVLETNEIIELNILLEKNIKFNFLDIIPDSLNIIFINLINYIYLFIYIFKEKDQKKEIQKLFLALDKLINDQKVYNLMFLDLIKENINSFFFIFKNYYLKNFKGCYLVLELNLNSNFKNFIKIKTNKFFYFEELKIQYENKYLNFNFNNLEQYKYIIKLEKLMQSLDSNIQIE